MDFKTIEGEAGKCFFCNTTHLNDNTSEDHYVALGTKFEDVQKFSESGGQGQLIVEKVTTTKTYNLKGKAKGSMCLNCQNKYKKINKIKRQLRRLKVIFIFSLCFLYLWHSYNFLSNIISSYEFPWDNANFFKSIILLLKAIFVIILKITELIINGLGFLGFLVIPITLIIFIISFFTKTDIQIDIHDYLVAKAGHLFFFKGKIKHVGMLQSALEIHQFAKINEEKYNNIENSILRWRSLPFNIIEEKSNVNILILLLIFIPIIIGLIILGKNFGLNGSFVLGLFK